MTVYVFFKISFCELHTVIQIIWGCFLYLHWVKFKMSPLSLMKYLCLYTTNLLFAKLQLRWWVQCGKAMFWLGQHSLKLSWRLYVCHLSIYLCKGILKLLNKEFIDEKPIENRSRSIQSDIHSKWHQFLFTSCVIFPEELPSQI